MVRNILELLSLGKKVGAEFINKEYQHYLKKRDDKRKQKDEEKRKSSESQKQQRWSLSGESPSQTSERDKYRFQKREEMRRKGIFVQAYSQEEIPTEYETTQSAQRPFVSTLPVRKLRWKDMSAIPHKRSQEESYREIDISRPTSQEVLNSKEKNASSQPVAIMASRTNYAPVDKSSEVAVSIQSPIHSPIPSPTVQSVKGSVVEKSATGATQVHLDHSEHSASKTSEMDQLESPGDKAYKKDKREDVFAALEEDVDLVKVLEEFDLNTIQGIRPDDKRSLQTAKKVLKVAFKEKAFEKSLTPKETDTITKFFSGKLSFDENVLQVLDTVLDKTIDYFKTRKTNLDQETKDLIEKREALKAAMLETMLSKPKFIPSSWVKQYEAYRLEAEKETNGINWAKIFLQYPRQRAFDDGAADVYGNFTRARRGHWLCGCIFGPNDSKTFEEVDREIKSQSLFMDTSIMQASSESLRDEKPPTSDSKRRSERSDKSPMPSSRQEK
ncbi:hypothetical protein GCK32_004984 [Trichostrongylus colubriformis]|uniref:DUF7774 domain-containing protein n=1 Tax=Trichostrongylus colubriformis TaxID=6319 RepID=A0AAN8F3U7_TRICO